MMQSTKMLLEKLHEENKNIYAVDLLLFNGTKGYDVYNVTKVFPFRGLNMIAGRVEGRDSELSSIELFYESGDGFNPIGNCPPFHEHQDPCITPIKDRLILGGVRHPVRMEDGSTGYYMQFYAIDSEFHRSPLFRGPDGMKDIRLIELPGGEIGIFTRPQGKQGGRGRIGFFTASNLNQVTPEAIETAQIWEDQFFPDEWGGVNQALILGNGKIGILGHIANFDTLGNRHYYPISFMYDPVSGKHGPMKILIERSMLPEGPEKRTDLKDVVFPGGIIRKEKGRADLYMGVSDAFSLRAEIDDPFLEYE